MFKLESNYEVYCFLKINLPEGYAIHAEPSPDYFTENFFRYVITKGDKELKILEGRFSEIRYNDLIIRAKKILREVEDDEHSK